MDLDWKSIAGVVAPLAPRLGSVLGASFGGPIGATIGGLAGSALAAAFGTEETPAAVGKAIAERPDAAQIIAKVEADKGEEIRSEALVKIEALKQETEQSRVYADDTNRARAAQLALVEAGSPLSWGAAILATVYTVAFFVILAYVLANPDAIKENQILLTLLGVLTGGQYTILGYFFGSSAGSKNNADRFATLASQVANKPNPSPAVVEAVKAASASSKKK